MNSVLPEPNPPAPFPEREGGEESAAPLSVSGRGWGRGYFRPLIPLLIAFMIGIVSGAIIPGHILWACGIALLCVPIIIRHILRNQSAAISPLILFAAAGYLSLQPYVSPILPSDHVSRFADDGKWEITGIIAEEPIQTEKRVKFVLLVETLIRENEPFPVSGNIRVTTPNSGNPLHYGDRITFVGRLKKPHNFGNPGGFDYERYLAFQKIRATAYAKEIYVSEKDSEKGLRWYIELVRRDISDLIKEYGKGKDETELLRASIMGDQSGISPETYIQFQRVGVAHLIAISGLNIAVIGGVTFVFFRWLLSRFRFFLYRAWTKKSAAIISMFPVIAYGLISGMAPPAARSVAMVLVFLAAYLFEKEHDPMNTLAVAALLVLALDPPSLLSVSFQLSFGCVFAMIYGASKMPELITIPESNHSEKSRTLRASEFFFSFMYASLCAILGTMPIAMLYFNQASIIGLLANIVFIPVYSYLVVVPGLCSVFLYPIHKLLASFGIVFCSKVLAICLPILKICSEQPLAAITTITPSYFEIILYYLLWSALLNLRRKIAKIVVIVVLIAGIADVGYWTYQRYFHKDLRVTFLDVGQGNSALVEFPGGKCMLVDGGGFFDPSILDVGSGVLAPFLWQKKIMTVEMLVLTHAHEDHIGGLPYIAENFDVKQVLMNGQSENSESYRKFMEIIRKKGIEAPSFSDIVREDDISGAKLKILHPPKEFDPEKNPNLNSVVMKLEFGDITILFTGDIHRKNEKKLVRIYGNTLKSTIIVAPHHGSKSSSSEDFLKTVKPEYVVFSAGWKNRFGFPKAETLERYIRQGSRIFRTDLNGAISVSTDGKSLKIKPFVESQSVGAE